MLEENNKDIHHGRNVKRFREAKGIKQEIMAKELFDCEQSKIVRIEQKSVIDDETLTLIAQYFNIDVEILKNLKEDPARVIVENNTFESGSNAYIGNGENHNDHSNTYNNPLEEISKLNKEKEDLYERLLQNEKDRIEQLMKYFEEFIKEKKQN